MSGAKPAPREPWENVSDYLRRIKVPGGWIYRTTDYSDGAPALVFVPWPPVPSIDEPFGGGLKDLAAATCRKMHPEPSDKVVCGGCFDAALEKINGQ